LRRSCRSALLEQIPKNLVGVTATVGESTSTVPVPGERRPVCPQRAGRRETGGIRPPVRRFELSSIWHRAYSFGNIDITAPYVNAKVAKDGSLNLLQ